MIKKITKSKEICKKGIKRKCGKKRGEKYKKRKAIIMENE